MLCFWGYLIEDEKTLGGAALNKIRVQSAFNAHYEAIRKLVPKERLLEYQVNEGWAPLCTFLDKPVPEIPFPSANSRADLLERIEAYRRAASRSLQNKAALLTAFMAIGVGAWLYFPSWTALHGITGALLHG